MSPAPTANSQSRGPRPLGAIGARAARTALRPVTGAMKTTVQVGLDVERWALESALESDELERFLTSILDDEGLRAMLGRVIDSDGARTVIGGFFDSGLFNQFIDRLLESDGLWRLVDVIASSDSVRAALSQQSLGFADQVGSALRERSSWADRRVERTAGRLAHREHDEAGGEES